MRKMVIIFLVFALAGYPRSLLRVSRSLLSTRKYASSSGASATASANSLRFTLASATKAYYANDVVKQVDVPTMAGNVGALANHVPLIASLKPGVVHVFEESGENRKFFVSSGSMSINDDSTLQVLAEEIVEIADIDQTAAQSVLSENQKKTEGSEVEKAEAAIRVEVAEAMLKAVSGTQ